MQRAHGEEKTSVRGDGLAAAYAVRVRAGPSARRKVNGRAGRDRDERSRRGGAANVYRRLRRHVETHAAERGRGERAARKAHHEGAESRDWRHFGEPLRTDGTAVADDDSRDTGAGDVGDGDGRGAARVHQGEAQQRNVA